MATSQPKVEASYYDEYSDPEEEQKARNGMEAGDIDEDDVDEEEEEDFVSRPRRDSQQSGLPPFIHNSPNAKRKSMDPMPTARGVSNGSHGPIIDPSSKKHKPEPLEPSILNAEPLDEFVLEIADWIHRVSLGKQNIEVRKSWA